MFINFNFTERESELHTKYPEIEYLVKLILQSSFMKISIKKSSLSSFENIDYCIEDPNSKTAFYKVIKIIFKFQDNFETYYLEYIKETFT